MKRINVSDIEKLLGEEDAARLISAIRKNQQNREYTVEVDLVFRREEKVKARNLDEARQIAEQRLGGHFKVADTRLDASADWFVWSDIRSRRAGANDVLVLDGTTANADWLRAGNDRVADYEREHGDPEPAKQEAPAVKPRPRRSRSPKV